MLTGLSILLQSLFKEPHASFSLVTCHQGWTHLLHHRRLIFSSRDSHNRPPYSLNCPSHTDWCNTKYGLPPPALSLGNAPDEWCLLLLGLAWPHQAIPLQPHASMYASTTMAAIRRGPTFSTSLCISQTDARGPTWPLVRHSCHGPTTIHSMEFYATPDLGASSPNTKQGQPRGWHIRKVVATNLPKTPSTRGTLTLALFASTTSPTQWVPSWTWLSVSSRGPQFLSSNRKAYPAVDDHAYNRPCRTDIYGAALKAVPIAHYTNEIAALVPPSALCSSRWLLSPHISTIQVRPR